MKTNIIILAVCFVLIAIAATITINYQQKYEAQKIENQSLKSDFDRLSISFYSLANSLSDLSKQKTYAISLNPTVETKISSVLGSSRQLTFQYYFTMDGNSIELKPDSTIVLKK
jgi:hypothetical protein